MKKDPVDRLATYPATKGLWDEAWRDEVRDQANEDIGAAIKSAEAVGPPDNRSGFEHVYATVRPLLEEQYQEFLGLENDGAAADAEGAFPL